MNWPTKVLLDTGIYIHSEFSSPATNQSNVRWGSRDMAITLHGVTRETPSSNPEYQKQIDALFTVGRLIREGHIMAFIYEEIHAEIVRGKRALAICNALSDCTFKQCPPPLDRAKFRSTISLEQYSRKGGKKDLKAGAKIDSVNQILFFKWLCSLAQEHIERLIAHADKIGLTEFEVQSLREVEWFRYLCSRSGSSENYPDVFHLWTAERNRLDAFLTLEARFPNIISNVRMEKQQGREIRTQVLRPLDLLQLLGIDKPDPVPLEVNRFYHLHETIC